MSKSKPGTATRCGNSRATATTLEPTTLKLSSSTARSHGNISTFASAYRLAELQLKVAWEEILKRFRLIEVVDEPVRVCSSILHGYTQLPVVAHRWELLDSQFLQDHDRDAAAGTRLIFELNWLLTGDLCPPARALLTGDRARTCGVAL